jgi:hypothetical protein
MKTVLTTLGISLLVLAGCAGQKQAESNFIQENIDNAVAQETIQTDIIEKSGKILNPRTIDKDGNIVYVPIDDWCSGFFPGNIWHMYELTGDQKWLPLAEKYTEDLDSVQYLTWHHDVGFMIGSSYLNGYRFAGKEEYSRSSYRQPNHCLPVSALQQAYFSHGMQTRGGRLNVAGNVPLSLII